MSRVEAVCPRSPESIASHLGTDHRDDHVLGLYDVADERAALRQPRWHGSRPTTDPCATS